MNEDRTEGIAVNAGGKIKSEIGSAVGDAGLQKDGLVDQVKGRARNAYGSATDAASSAYDRLPFEAREKIDRAYGSARNHPAISLAIAGGIGLLAFGASQLFMQDKPKRRRQR